MKMVGITLFMMVTTVDCQMGMRDGAPIWLKARTLSNWTKEGPVLQPSSPGQDLDSGSASGAYVTKFGSTYYMYYLGTPYISSGVPVGPYYGMLATSSSITGDQDGLYDKTGGSTSTWGSLYMGW